MPILLGLVSIVGLFAIYVATRPSAFRTARSLTIDAPPAELFAVINDFHQWGAWSPWEKVDPTMTRTYEGPSAGRGAVYRWSGNGKAGAGSMTWAMEGNKVFVAKAFGVFMDMDTLMGRDFEKGLEAMKSLTARQPG